MYCRNHMTAVIQQTKQKIMSRCCLQLDQRRYAVAENKIGIESDA